MFERYHLDRGKPISNSPEISRLVVETFSVSTLICALGVASDIRIVNYCAVHGNNQQQTTGNFQFTRDNRFDIQVEYARAISEILGAEFHIRYQDTISISLDFDYLIDINAIRKRQKFPKVSRIDFLAATPETISPLLGISKFLGLGSIKSRVACLRENYLKKGVRQAISPISPSAFANFYFNISPLNLDLLRYNVGDLARKFAEKQVNIQFGNLFDQLEQEKNSKILIVLPLPTHYGGSREDNISIAKYVKTNYIDEDYFIVIKNHPSDNEFHDVFGEILGDGKFIYLQKLYERNLPIELISITFMDRVTLISTGSTAMNTISANKSIIFWPSDPFGRKLALNIYGSIAKYLGIKQIPIKLKTDENH
jgi:hypothetical protein